MPNDEPIPQGTNAESVGAKNKFMLPAVVASVMLVEGVAIFCAVKMLGSDPQQAQAMDTILGAEADLHPKSVEMDIADFKALNEKSGLTFVVDISVSAIVPMDRAVDAERLVEEKAKTIVDRLSLAVRSAEPNQLKEEDLATIRRKMRHELDKILEDDTVVEELLITRFQKYRADF
jgi:flagellar basal body-associated protein FliL